MIRIVVGNNGWANAGKLFMRAKMEAPELARRALQNAGDLAIEDFREKARSGAFGPPPKRGGIPIVDTSTYINSWEARVAVFDLEMGPHGANKNMSNEALGQLLEHGTSKMAARPHMRSMAVWMQRKGMAMIAKEIFSELFRGK